MISNTMNSALQGLRFHQEQLNSSAQGIARFGTSQDTSGVEKDMVGLLVSRRGYQANLTVLKVADEMLGTMLDTFA